MRAYNIGSEWDSKRGAGSGACNLRVHQGRLAPGSAVSRTFLCPSDRSNIRNWSTSSWPSHQRTAYLLPCNLQSISRINCVLVCLFATLFHVYPAINDNNNNCNKQQTLINLVKENIESRHHYSIEWFYIFYPFNWILFIIIMVTWMLRKVFFCKISATFDNWIFFKRK